ncbi:hypothetical protein QH494_03570 [Sphingomonas sp. AR_OL41]|uniref:hypothetical protein n=1 Tax=Sphingomonas sp. AR_OL41 TaxID=3042729 RepID=UPI002480AA56|nr:hypothetical protein [Sphingomonas sp. AR_OL41]MDH7971248.1 hypothetical protein [Sphingomonas sp. AR_OL41]
MQDRSATAIRTARSWWKAGDKSVTFAHALVTGFWRPSASKAAKAAEILQSLGTGIMARLINGLVGVTLCATLLAAGFWVYEEIYFLSSDLKTETRKAVEIIKYTANQKKFDTALLKGPFPHNYSNQNREFIWILNGKVVVTIYFVYVPHDYEIRFSGKMSKYD